MTNYKPKNILSVGKDAKTSKGDKYGFTTGILYLAPANQAGRGNVCPMAKEAGCEKACLYTAGRGAMSNVQQARINKTIRFFDDRENFIKDLVYSVAMVAAQAEATDTTPLIRLNGTSDILWEKVPVIRKGEEYANIFDAFPSVQFYDYTKIPNRKNIPENYDLTFSYSGVEGYEKHIKKAKANKALKRIAVVFSHKERIPKTFNGLPVVDGDDSDIRHKDGVNVITALYAKGKAKKDTSGFVVHV